MSGIREKHQLVYELQRSAVPVLRLRLGKKEESDRIPACVKELLSEIPVPREIIFQSPATGTFSCYSARLDVEADERLGVKLPIAKFDLSILLPLKEAPRDAREAERVLTAWSLTPFFGTERGKGALVAKIVPDHLCRQCMGEKELRTERDWVPLLWP